MGFGLRGERAALIGLALLALGLRLALLDTAGFWRDEVMSLVAAHWPVADILFARFGEIRNQPPLHYLLIHAGLRLLGPPGGLLTQEAAARLPSALAGAATCVLVVVAGRRWFGAGAGLVAGLLLATSFGHLAQSVEARPYALLTGWSLLALLALDGALAGGRGAGWAWAGAVGAGLAAVATSYLAVYAVLPGLALFAAWRLRGPLRAAWPGPGAPAARRALRVPVLAALVLALGTAPAVPEMLSFNWTEKARPDNPLDALVKLLLYNGLSFGPAPGAPWAILLGALAVAGGLACTRLGARAALPGAPADGKPGGAGSGASVGGGEHTGFWGAPAPDAGRRGLEAILIVGGAGLVSLALSGPSDLVAPRYWSYSYPLLCLLAGNGWSWAMRGAARRPRPATGLAVTAGLVATFSGVPGVVLALAGQAVPPGTPVHPDYRAAARTLAATTAPGDLVAVFDEPEYGWRVCDWYWRTDGALPAGVGVTDAADPRLGSMPIPRRIYWLLATADPAALAALAASPPPGRSVAGQMPGVLILREENPGGATAAARLAALAADLRRPFAAGAAPRYLAVGQGMAAQAGGDLTAAVAWDRAAGTYRALGGEHLASATGFLARGEPGRALIDLAAARALQPADPAIHRAAATLLAAAGYPAAAAGESRLAGLLR